MMIKKMYFKQWLCAFIGLLSWVFLTPSYACDCKWQGPFTWLVDDADLVVLARFDAPQKGNARDVLIEDTLKGHSFDEVIRLWGTYKNYCRANVDQFPTGSRWVLVLDRIDEIPNDGFNPNTPNQSFGRKGDYALSRCGGYWLKEKNGMLTGNITSIVEWDYDPLMDPVPYDVVQQFIDGEVGYTEIIEHSGEITSKEAMLRRAKKELGRPEYWR